MVGGLVQLMKDAHLTTCLGCRGKDRIAEVILRDYLRATEGEEDTTRLNLLKRLLVQTGIALQGIMQRPTVFGKGRWIEDNQVVLAASLLQIAEGILAVSLMTGIAREVQLDIAVGEFDGLGTTIDGMHKFGPTPHGIKRESTGITEHIQYASALGKALEQQTVVALVDEEAGLLAAEPVDIEQQSVLHRRIIVAAAIDEITQRAIVGCADFIVAHLSGQRGFTLIIDMGDTTVHHLDKLAGNGLAAEVHADAMGLHDSRLAIDIDDQSGQHIALAMHKAIGVVTGIIGQSDGLSDT